MKKPRSQVIKFAKKLNITNLSALRSGNVSVRTYLRDKEGFFITPSGIKYNDLQEDKIVFLEMDEKKNEQKIIDLGLNPSSEWKFHQDIYINTPDAIAIVHAHSPYATAVSAHGKIYLHFIIWLLWLGVTILSAQIMQLLVLSNFQKISFKL